MPKKDNKSKGDKAEFLAKKYLKSKGFLIIKTNFRLRFGEIDIIAKDTSDEYIVFVEVKYRTTTNYGTPSQAINYTKIKKIKNTALAYLNLNDLHNKDVRFDVIEIIDSYKFSNKPEYKINHIKSAF